MTEAFPSYMKGSCADLTGAILRGADLELIRDDVWAVLETSPHEVPALLAALHEGRVDGSTYEGTCACLAGTIANTRKCHYQNLVNLVPNPDRPAECFFLAIRKGDMPATNQFSALAVRWIDEWIGEQTGCRP